MTPRIAVSATTCASSIAATDLDVFGFVIVAVLLLAWAVSWAMSRRRRGVSFAP